MITAVFFQPYVVNGLSLTFSGLRYFHLSRAHYLAEDQTAARTAYRKAVALGFQQTDVHPLEQPHLQTMLSELDLK